MSFFRIKISVILLFYGINCLIAAELPKNAFQTLTCNDTINLSLDINCQAQLDADILLEALDANESYQIFITFPTDSSGNYQNNGTNSVRLLRTGLYKYSVVNSSGSNCWGYIMAENKLTPIFTSIPRDTIIKCAIELTELGIGATKPTAFNGCDSTTVNFIEAFTEFQPSLCDTSIIVSIWKAADNHGNSVIDTQRTVCIRPSVDKLISPQDITLSCGEDERSDLEDLNKTGNMRIQTGKIVNHVFIPLDTILIDATKIHCTYAFNRRDVVKSSECETKITRHWNVIDWCNPTLPPSIIDTQFILYTDTLAPVFLTHENENLQNANIIEVGKDCQFDFNGPIPMAMDNCDTMPIVEMFEVAQLIDSVWTPIGSNIATLDLPADTFRLGYRAFDYCYSNLKEDTTYTYLVTRDLYAPEVICLNDLVIAIGEKDGAILEAEMVDGGSMDACGIITKEIRRKGVDTLWQTSIELPCELVDTQIMVELRVTDAVGNENICWTFVRIEDKVSPLCQNLPNQVVDCELIKSNDFGQPTDLNSNDSFDDAEWQMMTPNQMMVYDSTFGDPVCSDNITCKSYSIEQEYQRLEVGCGVGMIKRRYRGFDSQGNIGDWVEQQISVVYLANWTITFAADWEGDCNDTIPTPFINIENGVCENLSINFTEKTFTADEDYCLKVERIYQVINNCLFDTNTIPLTVVRPVDSTGSVLDSFRISSDSLATNAHFIYKQILKIRSTERPNIIFNEIDTCLLGIHADTIAPKLDNDCAEFKTFSAIATDCIGSATSNFRWEFYENDSLKASGIGASFSMLVLPAVNYKVQFIAADDCNNQSIEAKDFTFTDCVAPTLFTRTGITLELKEKTAEIWAVDFDKSSFDNCTDRETLLQNFRIWHESLGSPPTTLDEIRTLPTNLTFTCSELANQAIFIYAFDEAGNYDRIEAFVTVQDNQETCINQATIRLAGEIINEEGEKIEAVNVVLTGTMQANELTETDGKYLFNLPSGYQYAVRPYKSENPLNGVTTFDVILISKHILGLDPITSPYQRIAADVNKSGTITAFDMVQLRQLILNIIPDFPDNQSWRFVDAKYKFTSAYPENEPFPEAVFFEEMNQEIMDMDFIGIKIGDINGSAFPNNLVQSKDRSSKKFDFIIEDDLANIGEVISIPFVIHDVENIAGLQFALNFKYLQLVEIKEGLAKDKNIYIDENDKHNLFVSWNKEQFITPNKHFFSLTFKVKKRAFLSQLLTLNPQKILAEAYTEEGEHLQVDLQFTSFSQANKFELFQNKPNPFKAKTTIGFYLFETEEVNFKIIDIQGKTIKKIKAFYNEGYHVINIKKEQLRTSGIFYYQLAAGNNFATKKMVVLE